MDFDRCSWVWASLVVGRTELRHGGIFVKWSLEDVFRELLEWSFKWMRWHLRNSWAHTRVSCHTAKCPPTALWPPACRCFSKTQRKLLLQRSFSLWQIQKNVRAKLNGTLDFLLLDADALNPTNPFSSSRSSSFSLSLSNPEYVQWWCTYSVVLTFQHFLLSEGYHQW